MQKVSCGTEVKDLILRFIKELHSSEEVGALPDQRPPSVSFSHIYLLNMSQTLFPEVSLAMKVVVRRELWFTSGLNSSGNTHTVNP